MLEDPTDSRWGDREPLPDWLKGFRDHQIDAIYDIVGKFEDGAKVVFLDAPTGSGKTLIAEAVRRALGVKANYICMTKTLQEQFLHDFPYAKVLKGRANYPTFNQPENFTPGDWRSVSAEDCNWTQEEGCDFCPNKGVCPYERAKGQAVSASVAVLNMSYALAEWKLGDRSKFSGRDLTIIDECDELEGAVMQDVEVYISEKMQRDLNVHPPEKKTVNEAWVEWVADAIPKVKRAIEGIDPGTRDPRKLKRARRLKSLLSNLRLLDEGLREEKWVYTPPNKDKGPIIFKPIHVSDYARSVVWDHSDRFLCMSATIISPQEMAESLGLEDDEWDVVQVESTFPPENRPIYVAPVADVTRKNEIDAYRAVGKAVEEIANWHPDENILVHTVSYKLSDYLFRGLDQLPHLDGRVMTYSGPHEREEVLDRFTSSRGGIILAPSMGRGVDLPGDLCRVMVVAKVPFPFLGDKQISARLYGTTNGRTWYAANTVRAIVQMTGRGVRSETDQAVTYLLDRQFVNNLWKKNKRLLPGWWKEALVWDGSVGKRLREL